MRTGRSRCSGSTSARSSPRSSATWPQLQLDAPYLDAGHLDHGYAITAHRAQGATVDRTFVLGSDELYREWGYTALSRHRDEARFYVTQGDLGLDADHPPAPDPLAYGLQRLLGRSRAQRLASDQLPVDLDDDTLRTERSALADQLAADPLPTSPLNLELLEATETRAQEKLDVTAKRCELLARERDETPIWRRSIRQRIDHALDINREALPRLEEQHKSAHAEHQHARAAMDDWLARSRPIAEEYLALTDEHEERATRAQLAHARLDHYDHHPSPWHDVPPLDPPTIEPDLDLGW